MLYKQEGFVIRSVDYGENNKIITILNEHGHKVP
ncbi:recombination protein O N-terminal domain-containing protein, partial [Staphylococcus aureus]|nr:recombination protein O N-terminal domain-containing protein [Staphylococcus aureus]